MNKIPLPTTLSRKKSTTLDTSYQFLDSPSPSPSLSHLEHSAPGQRQNSEISLYDQKLSPSGFVDDTGNIPWTRKQWEALEIWYDKLDRDCQRASTAFYKHESIDTVSDTPLWSKEYILWRCQCLDTNTKYHNGVLPSARKRRKDLQRRLKKQNHLNRQSNSQQQQQQHSHGQTNITKNKETNIFTSSSISNSIRNSSTSET